MRSHAGARLRVCRKVLGHLFGIRGLGRKERGLFFALAVESGYPEALMGAAAPWRCRETGQLVDRPGDVGACTRKSSVRWHSPDTSRLSQSCLL